MLVKLLTGLCRNREELAIVAPVLAPCCLRFVAALVEACCIDIKWFSKAAKLLVPVAEAMTWLTILAITAESVVFAVPVVLD